MKTATVFEPSLDKKYTRTFTEVPKAKQNPHLYVREIFVENGNLFVKFWDSAIIGFYNMPFVVNQFKLKN